jgi:hypothetical protein
VRAASRCNAASVRAASSCKQYTHKQHATSNVQHRPIVTHLGRRLCRLCASRFALQCCLCACRFELQANQRHAAFHSYNTEHATIVQLTSAISMCVASSCKQQDASHVHKTQQSQSTPRPPPLPPLCERLPVQLRARAAARCSLPWQRLQPQALPRPAEPSSRVTPLCCRSSGPTEGMRGPL